MKSIRVVGVAALLAALFMMAFGQAFFAWWMNSTSFYPWSLAVTTLSPPVASTTAINSVGAATFICTCIGVALLVSCTVYSAFEELAAWAVAAWQGRNGQIEADSRQR